MTHVSFADLGQNLARYLDEAVDDGTAIVIVRSGARGNVVLLSDAEHAGLQETAYLLASPRNAERLLRGVRDADAGAFVATKPET